MDRTPTPNDIRAEKIILGKDSEYDFSYGIVRKVGPSAMCSADADQELKDEVNRINKATEAGPSEVVPGYTLVMPRGELAESVLCKLLNFSNRGIFFEDDHRLGLKIIKVSEDLLKAARGAISGRGK